MKQLTIIGNIGADAQLKTMTDGTQFSTFNVAVTSGQTTEWMGVLMRFRPKLHQYLIKGQMVYISGFPTFGIYNNKVDITINADHLELCGSPKTSPVDGSTISPSASAPLASAAPSTPTQTSIPVPTAAPHNPYPFE